MLKASIDIGSNSVLLLVAKVKDLKIVEVLENESVVCALGRGLDQTGGFDEQSMHDTYATLASYSQLAQKHGLRPSEIIITATEASRKANNAKEFFKKIHNELSLEVSIISAEQEATLSAQGILCGGDITQEEAFIMDIGGASTELIRVNTKTKSIIHSISLPIGAVRLTSWIKDQGLESAKKKMQKIFSDYPLTEYSTEYLYCVAGTMTSIGNMICENKEFIEDEVHGLELSYDQVFSLMQQNETTTAEEYLIKYPFLGKRSETIQAGTLLAIAILVQLKVHKLSISTYGLRYGSLLYFIPETSS